MLVTKLKKYWFAEFIALVFIIVCILCFTTPTDWKNWYYNINPKAGAIELENEYKNNFDGAGVAMTNANLVISQMQTQTKNTAYISSSEDKIRGYFSMRDASFVEMLRIDNEALQLHLPQQYKDFLLKRQKADQNDYDAFKIYYKGMGNMMDAILALSQYEDAYKNATGMFWSISTKNNFSPASTSTLNVLVGQLDKAYQRVEVLSEQDLFTQNLLNFLQQQYNIVTLFRQLNDAIVANDQAEQENIVKTLTQKISQKAPDEFALLGEWNREKTQPLSTAQDEKHKKSWDLYNQAYLYAKNQFLNDILMVWDGNPPGTVNHTNPTMNTTQL